MAPVKPTEDYYAILEISLAADFLTIKSSYRRLALIKHPDRAKDKLKATEDFQLLQAAYSTLSDSKLRKEYDLLYHLIQRSQPSYSTKPKETTPQEKSNTSTASDRAQSQEKDRQNDSRVKKLQELAVKKKKYDDDIFEERRKVKKLQSELKILQDQAAKNERARAEENGWTSFLASFVVNPPKKTEDEKAEASRRDLDNSTAQRIKIRILDHYADELQVLCENLAKVETEISAIHEEILLETRKETEAKQKAAEQEAQRARAEADRLFEAEVERVRKEWEAKMKAEDRRQAAEAEQRRKQDAEKSAKQAREFEDLLKKSQEATAESRRQKEFSDAQRRQAAKARETTPQPGTKSVCDHRSYWARLEGRHSCSHCLFTTTKFAFQCPRCDLIACANCREMLKGKKSSSRNTA